MGIPSQMFVEGIRSTETQNKQPRLSVIVPAYNVDPYLDKCLQSICDQTFTDFEVILVNDGSTDNTLAICQTWAQRDKRIRLIDQENQGLAEVRNIGLRESRADMIMFVDSDDWLELDAIEHLLKLKEKQKAQISIGSYVIEKEGVQIHNKQVGDRLLTGQQAYLLNLYDRALQSYCWAKIFDKSLFEGIKYPTGQYMEDYCVTYLVLLRAQHVACSSKIIYHYLSRETSILNDSTLHDIRTAAFFEMLTTRYEHARTAGYLTKRQFALWRLKVIRRIVRTTLEGRTYGRYMPGTPEMHSVFSFLSFACGKPVQDKDLKHIYAWTRRKKIFAILFGWL
ncbi:MAG: glycosyltransferase family 2 protein [Bacteroides sp.]|jgi:putative glycosyltransferase